MKVFIRINFLSKKYYTIDIEPYDSIRKLKKKIEKASNISFTSIEDSLGKFQRLRLQCCGKYLLDGYLIAYYYFIGNESTIEVSIISIGGGPIDNLIDEGNDAEIAKPIGFDMKLIKRNELHINLIHFDLNLTNKENFEYFNNFKVDVVGGFHAIDDLNIFKQYLKEIKKKNIPFIVISSGSSGKDIIPICKKYSFIKEVIIFCKNYEYNKNYINEYPGYVKKVLTSIEEVYNYLKTFEGKMFKESKYITYSFSLEDIKMNNQFQQCPVITAQEYDKCYFLIHRGYSFFFKKMNLEEKGHCFSFDNCCIIEKYLKRLNYINEKEKIKLENIFLNLRNVDHNEVFIEEFIRAYTGESIFCYLFNRIMRNFEPGLIYLSYFMGPLLFEINRYVKKHPNFGFSTSMTLYRIIECPKIDFYLYKLNLNHIICFPSITSTSSKPINFKPTALAAKINKGKNIEDRIKIKMIFKYIHEYDNISPGIIIENKKGFDGDYISKYPNENEVILFPFTFTRILDIKSEMINGEEIQIINLEIINRKSYLEYILRDNINKRILFSNLDYEKEKKNSLIPLFKISNLLKKLFK